MHLASTQDEDESDTNDYFDDDDDDEEEEKYEQYEKYIEIYRNMRNMRHMGHMMRRSKMRRTMVQVIMIYALTKLPFVGFEEKSWTKLDGCMYMMKEKTNCWLVGI